MNTLLSISWAPSPEIFTIGPITLRWYGLFFATGFLIGYMITQRVFKLEKANEKLLDSLLLSLLLGTVIGARLGHVLFYDPVDYLSNPIKILKIWEGGLASHGGTIGVILAVWLWSKYISKRPFFWITDRIAMSVALTSFFIRMGNLMNSEILGTPSDLPWAFEFTRAYITPVVPRHPAQLYEALAYMGIFILTSYLFWKTRSKDKPGFITGLFLALVFGSRFLIEFVKIEQAKFDATFLETFTMGQWLSIPFVLLGLYFMYRGNRNRIS